MTRFARCPATRCPGSRSSSMLFLPRIITSILLLLHFCSKGGALENPEVVIQRVKEFSQNVGERIERVNNHSGLWPCECVYHGCQDRFRGPVECMDTNGQPEHNSCTRDNMECSPLKIFTNFSIVRTPPEVEMSMLANLGTNNLMPSVVEDICMFQGLEIDNVFQKAAGWDSVTFPGWIYFGSAAGVLVRWPGSPRERVGQTFGEECLSYDPRVRPWYVPAIGNKRAVVILLDEKDIKLGNPLVKALLETLSHGDAATILPFRSDLMDTEAKIKTYNLPLLIVTGDQRNTIMTRLIDKQPLGLRTAFKFAFDKLRNALFEPMDKIVIYVSGASISSRMGNQVLRSLDPFRDPGDPISVLAFTLQRHDQDPSAVGSSFAKKLSCKHYGVWTPVPDPKQPNLRAYLSLAALPSEHGPNFTTDVHVSEVYQDTSGLGWVVTISSPVFETCGDGTQRKLRGVVGVDKQLGLLKNDGLLEKYFERQLSDRTHISLRNVPDLECHLQRIREEVGSLCSDGGPTCKKECAGFSTPLQSSMPILCHYGDEFTDMDGVDSSICCGEDENNRICKFKQKKQINWILWTIILGSIVVLAVLAWSAFHIYRLLKQRRKDASRAIIGKGATGFVTKGMHNGVPVALKVFDKNTVEAQRELNCLLHIPEHKNIVRLIQADHTRRRNGQFKKITLYLELMDMNLKEFVNSPKCFKDLSYSVLLMIFLDIVEGLRHLHAHGLVHRDLKPENILVKLEGDNILVKICDMGHSKQYLQSSNISVVRGSRGYISPEIMARAYAPMDEEVHFGPESDVYSLGVLMSYCIMRDDAFGAEQNWDMPPPLHKLITDCTDNDPRCRPTLAAVRTDLLHFHTCSWVEDLVYSQ